MKLSFALVVPMTTAASMASAVEDATATAAVNQKHGRHIGYNQDHHQKHLHQNQNPNASTQVQESLQGLEEATTAAVKSDLLFNKEHSRSMGSRTTTTIGSGSGDGVTGDIEVDVGLLQTKRRLNSVGEDCDSGCDSRPKIEVSGTDFQDLVRKCTFGEDDKECPDNVPIGCWDTSEVTNMAYAFYYIGFFNESINCWNTARVTDMAGMFYKANNFNQPLDDWNPAKVISFAGMFNRAYSFNQSLDDWNVASVKQMPYMFYEATAFNQCLSTWADESPPNVSVYGMFEKSGCPDNANPNPSEGPWCQGDNEQCSAPQSPGTSSFTSLFELSPGTPTTAPTPKQKKTTKKNNKN